MSEEWFFSASTLGFYLKGANDPLPRDCKPVTKESKDAILAELAHSPMVLGSDSRGLPVIAERRQTNEEALRDLRAKRDVLLLKSDKTQVPDFPLTERERTAWFKYRVALRELPKKYASNPGAVEWPKPPTEGVV